jgi:hypothetical protein
MLSVSTFITPYEQWLAGRVVVLWYGVGHSVVVLSLAAIIVGYCGCYYLEMEPVATLQADAHSGHIRL